MLARHCLPTRASPLLRSTTLPLAASPSLIHVAPHRTKVILPAAHPHEYFRNDWNPSDPRLPAIPHPQLPGSVMDPTVAAAMSAGTLAAPKVPLYFQITLRRSLIGLPWNTRYALGVLFKKYSPAKRYRPGAVAVRISTNTVIYREATSDVADLVVQLKEVLAVRNVWTVEEYREGVKALLGKRALTEDELQARRGYYVVGSAIPRKSVKTAKQASVTSADADASAEQAQATQ